MANTVYENKIIESKAQNLLSTAVNTRNLVTVDTDLEQEAGMTKTINVYTYTGQAEEVANGAGNTQHGSISFTGKDYKVKMVQEHFAYTDEEFMKDPSIVDHMIEGATQVMKNKMTADFVTEVKKASKAVQITKLNYDAIVDGISELNTEDESGLFVVIPNAWKAELRKDPDYKSAEMGKVIYNGQVGTVCGLPVIATKALTDAAFVMTKLAVKLFMKKEVEVELDRDADKRTNNYYLRAAYVEALTDESQICKLHKGA